METHTAKNIEFLIGKRNITPTALADATKVPQPTIHRILSGESRDPKTSTLQPLAQYFGVTVSDLRDKDLSLGSGLVAAQPTASYHVNKIPVISWVQAGGFSEVVDDMPPGVSDTWEEVTVPVRRHTFGLYVKGDSMAPDFPDGTLLVIEPDMEAQPGDYVIAKNGGEATFKLFVKDGPDYYLKPLNPHYPMKPFPADGVIVGVVREMKRKFR